MTHLMLDIGNVLVNQDMEPFIKVLSKQMNLSKQDAFHFLNRIQKKQDLGITTLSDEVITHFNIKSEYIVEEILEAWRSTVVPNEIVLKFMDELIGKYGVKVALVSNLGFEHMNYFNKVLRDYLVFSDSIHHFSCKVGARKPTALYYKLLLDLHPEFEGSIYVDDLLENLNMGSNLGFKTFHFDLSNLPYPITRHFSNQDPVRVNKIIQKELDKLETLLISS